MWSSLKQVGELTKQIWRFLSQNNKQIHDVEAPNIFTMKLKPKLGPTLSTLWTQFYFLFFSILFWDQPISYHLSLPPGNIRKPMFQGGIERTQWHEMGLTKVDMTNKWNWSDCKCKPYLMNRMSCLQVFCRVTILIDCDRILLGKCFWMKLCAV